MCSQFLIIASIIHLPLVHTRHSNFISSNFIFSNSWQSWKKSISILTASFYQWVHWCSKRLNNLSEVAQTTRGHNRIEAKPKLVSFPLARGLLRWSPSVLRKVQGAVWFCRYHLRSINDTYQMPYIYIYSVYKQKNTNTPHAWSGCWLHTHVQLWEFFKMYAHAVCNFLNVCDPSINFTS